MVIVDASVVIDYLEDRRTRHTEWLDQRIDVQRVGITSLTQTEILQGIRSEEQFRQALMMLDSFEMFEIGSSLLAIASARNYRALRKMGITVRSTIDCLIATYCIDNAHQLLHNDRDFDAFEKHLNLRVLHPLKSILH